MSLRVKQLLLFFLMVPTTGLTGFRFYPFKSSVTDPSAFSYYILQGSKVSVTGATNVNEFTCFSDETYSQHSANLFISELRNSITFHGVILNIKTESLQCGNEVMNKNLFETLNAEKYPFIVVELKQAATKDGQPINFSQWIQMTGKTYITLAGQRRFQQIDFTAKQNSDGTYHFVGEHNISFNQYNLVPPTALFGLVKVKDVLTVKFDLLVKGNGVMLQ